MNFFYMYLQSGEHKDITLHLKLLTKGDHLSKNNNFVLLIFSQSWASSAR